MHYRTGKALLEVPEKVRVDAKIHIIGGWPVPWARRQGAGSPCARALASGQLPGTWAGATLAWAPGPLPPGLGRSWNWVLGLAGGGNPAQLKAGKTGVINNPLPAG